MSLPAAADIQRQYYADTATAYEAAHLAADGEHYLALAFMVSMLDRFKIRSILDVGAGTGRAVAYLKKFRPDILVVGLEPVKELRDVGHAAGLSEQDLADGDATRLKFADGSFDLVCEFGVLHHIERPELAVAEMLRVAKKAIFISDSNNFGQGGSVARFVKQAINLFGLWRWADLIRTRGKGYTISEGDGLAYSYSVFNNYKLVRASCQKIHLLNTTDGAVNPYRSASHVALLGIKA